MGRDGLGANSLKLDGQESSLGQKNLLVFYKGLIIIFINHNENHLSMTNLWGEREAACGAAHSSGVWMERSAEQEHLRANGFANIPPDMNNLNDNSYHLDKRDMLWKSLKAFHQKEAKGSLGKVFLHFIKFCMLFSSFC